MEVIDSPSQLNASEASHRPRILLNTALVSQYQSEYINWHKLGTQEIIVLLFQRPTKCMTE